MLQLRLESPNTDRSRKVRGKWRSSLPTGVPNQRFFDRPSPRAPSEVEYSRRQKLKFAAGAFCVGVLGWILFESIRTWVLS